MLCRRVAAASALPESPLPSELEERPVGDRDRPRRGSGIARLRSRLVNLVVDTVQGGACQRPGIEGADLSREHLGGASPVQPSLFPSQLPGIGDSVPGCGVVRIFSVPRFSRNSSTIFPPRVES